MCGPNALKLATLQFLTDMLHKDNFIEKKIYMMSNTYDCLTRI